MRMKPSMLARIQCLLQGHEIVIVGYDEKTDMCFQTGAGITLKAFLFYCQCCSCGQEKRVIASADWQPRWGK